MLQFKSFLFLLLALSACNSAEKAPTVDEVEQELGLMYVGFDLKAGDILFQDSDCGPFCESIEKVTFGIDGAKFSHVGMLIQKETEDFVVLEAISRGVVETPLDTFFARSFDENNKSKVAVGRLISAHEHLIPQASAFAKTKLGADYDSIFDIENEKYYCSELIYESFKFANQNTPIFELQPMTYKDPETDSTFPIWKDYFEELGVPIPAGEPGLNPGGMSKSPYLEVVHFYGKPEGYMDAND